jgi:hypothetical protein
MECRVADFGGEALGQDEALMVRLFCGCAPLVSCVLYPWHAGYRLRFPCLLRCISDSSFIAERRFGESFYWIAEFYFVVCRITSRRFQRGQSAWQGNSPTLFLTPVSLTVCVLRA